MNYDKINKLCVILMMGVLCCCGAAGCATRESNTMEGTNTMEDKGMAEKDDTCSLQVISAEGKTDYTIWYEESLNCDTSVMRQIERVRTIIKDKTDAIISCSSDRNYVKSIDSGQPAILVGRTAFSETEVIDNYWLKTDDFFVGTVENKIMIYGTTQKACSKALDYFCEVLEEQEAKDKTLTFSAEHEMQSSDSYEINSIDCMGTQLSRYCIVYPDSPTTDEKFFAYIFRYYLLRNYGYNLEIVSDDEDDNEYEILIGNTARTTQKPQEGQFVVSAGNNKLQLFATDMQSYESMYQYITKDLLKQADGGDHIISEGFTYVGDKVQTLEAGTQFAAESLGDVRFMFYNVYGYKAQCGPIDERQNLQEQLIKTYMPDVLAFQEYSGNYHSTFTYRLRKSGYSEVEVLAGVKNYTPLFYRKDRLKVVDSGYLLYDGPNDNNSKSVTWAVFEVLESGKQFIAMSTHFMYNQSGIDANAARISNAEEAAALIAELRSNDDYKKLPILFGGDLNCNMKSEPIEKLTESGLLNAWESAEVKNDSSGHHNYATYNEEYQTYSAWGIPVGGYLGSKSIDHVFVSENTVVKSFATLMDMYAFIASDHLPELVEISLK